ncbi:MAG TPA: ribosome silencing factor [Acidimicrobiales bacterium]|nr:ribosome silencing factor [Acidimicrobiales bacterium]
MPAEMVRPSGDADDGSVDIPPAAYVAAAAADDKLGQDTVVLFMGELFGVVDAFVVTSGRNTRQVHTLVEEIEQRVKEGGGPSPRSVEGLRDGGWVLMDYGDFVVHVFLDEVRHFYDLEHLWSGAPRVPWQDRIAG